MTCQLDAQKNAISPSDPYSDSFVEQSAASPRINVVSVIGLGYIGLPTAAMFASSNVKVVGVDINHRAVNTINEGRIHITEPNLDAIVQNAVSTGYLRASTTPEPADAFLIAVPTPFKNDHEPDLSYVQAAAESIAPVLKKGDIVILESTSPVGATEKLMHWLSTARPDLRFPISSDDSVDIHVAYCPERVLPGQVIRELVENDRIIGGMTAACSNRAAEVYRIFVQGKLLFTNARTAEMCKLTENAYRDLNIAFANELSLISSRLDINVWELIRLANHHPRVNILEPGCGVGGHCIAVDPWFIVNRNPEEARLIRAAREVNDYKPHWIMEKIRKAVDELAADGKAEPSITVAVFGLSYKPNIDDLRESPALQIAEQLSSSTRTRVLVVEPNIDVLPASLNRCELVPMDIAAVQSDIVVLLVKHSEFAHINAATFPNQRIVDAIGMIVES